MSDCAEMQPACHMCVCVCVCVAGGGGTHYQHNLHTLVLLTAAH